MRWSVFVIIGPVFIPSFIKRVSETTAPIESTLYVPLSSSINVQVASAFPLLLCDLCVSKNPPLQLLSRLLAYAPASHHKWRSCVASGGTAAMDTSIRRGWFSKLILLSAGCSMSIQSTALYRVIVFQTGGFQFADTHLTVAQQLPGNASSLAVAKRLSKPAVKLHSSSLHRRSASTTADTTRIRAKILLRAEINTKGAVYRRYFAKEDRNVVFWRLFICFDIPSPKKPTSKRFSKLFLSCCLWILGVDSTREFQDKLFRIDTSWKVLRFSSFYKLEIK